MKAKNHLALWAGLTALLTNLASINIIILLGDPDNAVNQALAAVITSLLVGGVVYSKQMWDDAKKAREASESKQDK